MMSNTTAHTGRYTGRRRQAAPAGLRLPDGGFRPGNEPEQLLRDDEGSGKSIDDNTARAMQDVSDSMEQIQALDVETLNQSILELKESVESLNSLFGK